MMYRLYIEQVVGCTACTYLERMRHSVPPMPKAGGGETDIQVAVMNDAWRDHYRLAVTAYRYRLFCWPGGGSSMLLRVGIRGITLTVSIVEMGGFVNLVVIGLK